MTPPAKRARAPLAAPRPALSVLAARQWAQLIGHYRQHLLARGALRPDSLLTVLDLHPLDGRNSWPLLQALAEQGLQSAIRYCPVAPAHTAPWWQHAPFCHTDLALQALHWPDHAALPQPAGPPRAGSATGPAAQPADAGLAQLALAETGVVVLWHDRWHTLAQQHWAVHHGRWFQRQHAGGWEHATPPDWLAPHLYEAVLNSASVSLPTAARAQLQTVLAACGDALLLAAAPGASSPAEFRRLSTTASAPLPVNFHLLAQTLDQAGAAWRHWRLDNGVVLQVAIRDGGGDGASWLAGAAAQLASADFADGADLPQAMASLPASATPQLRLLLLRRAGHDPAVLQAAGMALARTLVELDSVQQAAWQASLERVWQAVLPSHGHALLRPLAAAAMALSAWGLARRVLQRALAQHGAGAAELAWLAWCEARTGDLARAVALVDQARQRDPADATVHDIGQRLASRIAALGPAWRRRHCHPDLPLVLEALDASHAGAFHRQFRDPQMAIMLAMPALTTPAAALAWIEAQQACPASSAYALLHRDHGLVGVLGFTCAQGVAFFSFWIGADFQGQGWAAPAAQLACAQVRPPSAQIILAAAYTDNQRSARALQRAGFIELAPDPGFGAERRYFVHGRAQLAQAWPAVRQFYAARAEHAPHAQPAALAPA